MDNIENAEINPPSLDKLAAALAAFQAEVPTVMKSRSVQVRSDKGSYSYTYAGLANVTEVAMPLLAKHGLSFSTLPENGRLTGMLLHSSGQHLSASLPITGGTPQAIGSSLTYMRRYLLGCMTGVVTDDDDDGQAASASTRRATAPTTSEPTRTMSRKPNTAPPKAEPTPHADDGWVPPTDAPAKELSHKPKSIEKNQQARLHILFGECGITGRDSGLGYLTQLLGRPVDTTTSLSGVEAAKAIDALMADKKAAS